MRGPVAYLRRSSADDANPGDVSRPAQERAVRDLAARDGVELDDSRIFVDWGKSADEAKEAKRAAFLSMLSAIERGEVEVVYAASLDRLYRSMRTFVRLTDAAKAHGVRIVTAREGVLGGDGSPMARAFAEITAVFSSLELNTIKARNHAALAERKRRGDRFGVAPYGWRVVRDEGGTALKPIRWEEDPDRPLAPLLEAYRRAGTVMGACEILDHDKVPTAHGGTGGWHPSALTLILAREGVLPPSGKRVQVSRSALYSGLLVCSCKTRLTPDVVKGGYYCRFAKWHKTDVHDRAVHGSGWVKEAALLPLVKEEMTHLDPPDAYAVAESHEAERAALLERRRRLAILFADGLKDDEEYRSELTGITRALDTLGDLSTLVDIPEIDWDADVADVNEALRAFLARIELDATMRPSGPSAFVWRVPSMRKD